MTRDPGLGARKLRTKAGPSYAAAGKSLTISQPSSSAAAISVAVPQPGMYTTRRRLQSRATSSL